MTGSRLAEFPVAGVLALLWPAAAVIAAVRAIGRPRAPTAVAVDAQTARDLTLWAGVVAVCAMIFGLVVIVGYAMRKSDFPPVATLLVFNAVGLALAALPLAAIAARGRALDARTWIGLLLACGVFALVWGPLHTILPGSFDLTFAPGLPWLAVGWPIAAIVVLTALPRRGSGVHRAGVRLAWVSLVLALAAVVCAAAIVLGGADHVLGTWLFPHHVGLVVAASIAGIGTLARGDRAAVAWFTIAIAEALLLAEAITVGAGLAL